MPVSNIQLRPQSASVSRATSEGACRAASRLYDRRKSASSMCTRTRASPQACTEGVTRAYSDAAERPHTRAQLVLRRSRYLGGTYPKYVGAHQLPVFGLGSASLLGLASRLGEVMHEVALTHEQKYANDYCVHRFEAPIEAVQLKHEEYQSCCENVARTHAENI